MGRGVDNKGVKVIMCRVIWFLLITFAALLFAGCGPRKPFTYEDNEYILTTGSLLFIKGDIAHVRFGYEYSR